MKNIIVLIIGTLLFITNAYAAKGRSEFSVGIVPQQSARKILKNWSPIFEFVEEKTGYRFTVHTAPDIPTFEKRLLMAKYDVVYLNPYQYVKLSDNHKYYAIAKEANASLQGILVVNKGSNIGKISQLEGQSIVFPRNAFAASQITQAYLNRLGINFKQIYVNTHDLSYGGVLHSLFAAGGGVVRTYSDLKPQVRDNLQILWTSRNYATHAIAVSSSLPKEVAKKIAIALSQLESDPSGKQYLSNLRFKGFQIANDEDWNDIRILFDFAVK